MNRLAGPFLLALATGVPLVAQESPVEPVLVELQLGRLVSRTVPAHRSGDVALIPLRQFFEMAELRTRVEGAGDMVVILQPGNRRMVLRPQRRLLEIDGASRPLTAAEMLVQDGEIYLSTKVLEPILGFRFQAVWEDLEVTAVDPDQLPVAQRLRREEANRRLAGGAQAARADGLLRESPWPVEGLVVDYSLLVPTDPGPSGGAYSLGAGINLLGGALESRIQNEGNLEDGKVRFDLSWLGVWRDRKWLSQLRLGDGFTSGPRTRSVRGISLGNVPFRRPDIIGQLPFATTLGPGWQVEAYRGGRLISFDSVNALGQFSLDVPLQYGENPVDFIAYGPFGEVRQFNRTYRVSSDVIPARRLEYGLSGGACRKEGRCDVTANADFRYGLSTRWTVFAGADRFWRDTLPDLFHPYGGVTGSLTNAIGVEAEAVGNALLRGLLRIEPSSYFLLAAEAARFDRDVADPILTVGGRRSQFTVFGQARPFGSGLRNWLSLDASYDRIQADEGVFTTSRLGASLQPGQVRFIPSIRWYQNAPLAGGEGSTRTTLGLNTVVLPFPGLGAFLGQVSARTGLEWDTKAGFQSAFAYVNRPIVRNVRLELGASWITGQRAALTAFFAADLPEVRAYTTTERPSVGAARLTQFVLGSVLADDDYQAVAFSVGPSLQQAGVSGRAFLDLNDNGRLDDRELVLPGVGITVGPVARRTDSSGTYRLWPLGAYERYVATVDTATLASPLWVPAYEAISLETRPNRFVTLNIPVLSGGTVEGRLSRQVGASLVPVAGGTVILRHRRTGRETRVATFNDGSFYVLGVRPGDWEATVDSGLLARFDGQADPVRFTIRQVLEGQAVSGVNLLIR
jgi:hypothetical protein